jgi:hypothetical protein
MREGHGEYDNDTHRAVFPSNKFCSTATVTITGRVLTPLPAAPAPGRFRAHRNFGLLANRKRATTFPLCFHLLGAAPQTE